MVHHFALTYSLAFRLRENGLLMTEYVTPADAQPSLGILSAVHLRSHFACGPLHDQVDASESVTAALLRDYLLFDITEGTGSRPTSFIMIKDD